MASTALNFFVYNCMHGSMHSLRIACFSLLVYSCSLSDNNIDDAGIQALVEGIKHCPMEKLK